jgi:hypothetical protein
MNRQQYHDRFRNTNIDPREIERKWHLFMEEQSNFQTMMQLAEAARNGGQAAVAAVGGGGSAPTNPVTFGQSWIMTYENEVTGKVELFTVNATNKTIGPISELDLTTNASIYYTEILDGKGFLVLGQGSDEGENGLWFAFVDSAGKVLKFVKNTGVTSYSSYTSEGLSVSMSYRSEAGIEVYWWMGGEIFNTTITNASPVQNYVYYDWFGYYSATEDGTFSFYYADDQSNERVYLGNAQGNAVELQIDAGVDRYHNSSLMGVNGTVIAVQYYNTDTGVYDLVRVFETDGTYTDLDLSAYEGNNADIFLYGTNKFAIVLFPDNTSIDRTVLSYNTSTKSMVTATYAQADYANLEYVYTNEPGNLTDSWGSPEGCETLWLMALSGGSNYDGDHGIDVYDGAKSMCLLDGASSFIEETLSNFAPIFSYSDYAKIPTLFCHRDGVSNLELMVITPEGTVYGDTGSLWTDVQSYFDLVALGDYVLTTYYNLDNDPIKQSFAIWNGTTIIDEFWNSTNNAWQYNWKVAVINQFDEEKTYYFTPASGEWKFLSNTYADYYFSDFSGYSDYFGNHKSGIIRLRMNPDNSIAMITPETVDVTTFAIENIGDVRTNANKLINIYQRGDDNFWVIEIFDFSGNRMVNYSSYNDTYFDLYTINDRIIFMQTRPDGSVIFTSFYPDYTISEFVIDSGVNPFNNRDISINDFRWWN